jgi:hypothetical protein
LILFKFAKKVGNWTGLIEKNRARLEAVAIVAEILRKMAIYFYEKVTKTIRGKSEI